MVRRFVSRLNVVVVVSDLWTNVLVLAKAVTLLLGRPTARVKRVVWSLALVDAVTVVVNWVRLVFELRERR